MRYISKTALSLAVAALTAFSAVFAAPQGETTIRPVKSLTYTPQENLFSAEGDTQKYILLDLGDDGFLVMSYLFCGVYRFDTSGSEKFNPESPSNVGYWLNNTLLNDGFTYGGKYYSIPAKMKPYINEHDWLTEGGPANSDYRDDFVTRCKVAVLSKTEWNTYYTKFGYADDQAFPTMMLRTSAGGIQTAGGEILTLTVNYEKTMKRGQVRVGTTAKNYAIRPVFWLDEDFFTHQRLNLNSLGDNVKKALRENFTREQLGGIYKKSELDLIFGKLPPQALDVYVLGRYIEGETLTGYYTYYSPDGTAEDGTEIRWLRSDSQSGIYSVIPGTDNSPTYKITKKDIGKYIVMEVIPKSAGVSGRPFRSVFARDFYQQVKKATKPEVRNLTILGTPSAGCEIYADYNYYDENGLHEDGTLFEWETSSDGTVFKKCGSEKSYILKENDKFVRVSVTPANGGISGYGNKVTSETVDMAEYEPEANYTTFEILSLNSSSEAVVLKSNGVLPQSVVFDCGGAEVTPTEGYDMVKIGAETYILVKNGVYAESIANIRHSGGISIRNLFYNVTGKTDLYFE